MNNIGETTGPALRKLRLLRGRTIAEQARRLRISPSTLGRAERAVIPLSDKLAARLARDLGLDVPDTEGAP